MLHSTNLGYNFIFLRRTRHVTSLYRRFKKIKIDNKRVFINIAYKSIGLIQLLYNLNCYLTYTLLALSPDVYNIILIYLKSRYLMKLGFANSTVNLIYKIYLLCFVTKHVGKNIPSTQTLI